jgi:hypothetical protein
VSRARIIKLSIILVGAIIFLGGIWFFTTNMSSDVSNVENTTTPAPVYKKVMTTLFWVGEESGPENDYIANDQSYFDEDWQEHFGGVDDPNDRCGYHPCTFTPRENPFYFALPYGDIAESTSVLKNRWIEVVYKNKKCYAQWEDVGPGAEDDFDYVFGANTDPKNTFNQKAGLDVSPAMWMCLGMPSNDYTQWRFVEESAVPQGPWREIITR